MTSKYQVVIYQNMISGEYVNIGVYTYNDDDTKVYSKFHLDWTRINVMLSNKVDDKADPILDSLVANSLSKVENKDHLQDVIKMCNSPYASLQILPPRASLLSADKLLEDIEKDFLVK